MTLSFATTATHVNKAPRQVAMVGALLLALSASAQAAPITFSGYLNDPSNPSLVGSDFATPLFDDDWSIANNVALYSLTVAQTGLVSFESAGFAAGGIDPYFTVFAGTGPTALFLSSTFDQAFSTGGDFVHTIPLLAGEYTLAIGAFANMSVAENLGIGSLGDGFIQLGVPELGNSFYSVTASKADSTSPVPVPEPATLVLVGTGLGVLASLRRRRNSREREGDTPAGLLAHSPSDDALSATGHRAH